MVASVGNARNGPYGLFNKSISQATLGISPMWTVISQEERLILSSMACLWLQFSRLSSWTTDNVIRVWTL